MHSPWISHRQTNGAIRRLRGRCRPLLENLEGRQLLSQTFIVTSKQSTGPNTLAQEISDSNSATATEQLPNIINFDIGNSGANETITITGTLTITQPVVISGFSQNESASAPPIKLTGSSTSVGVSITGSASGTTIQGLSIVDFSSDAVQLDSVSNVTITQNYIGVTTSGNSSGTNGGNGITIVEGSLNTIGGTVSGTIGGSASGSGNVISASGGNGIEIEGSSNNSVLNNFIGTNAAGNNNDGGKLSNDGNGVYITAYPTTGSPTVFSSYNTIGASVSGDYNVISDNAGDGVDIDKGSTYNVVEGNRIGTAYNGKKGYDGIDLGNHKSGVLITGSKINNVDYYTNYNTIGGSAPFAGNLISDNTNEGVDIYSYAEDNSVEGNLIGIQLDANHPLDGTTPLGNLDEGVLVHGGASSNTIGGTATGASNMIVGNVQSGVEIASGASSNTVAGNRIGINGNGTAVANQDNGVYVEGSNSNGSTSDNTISGNTISGNNREGVELVSPSTGTLLEGNWIGIVSNSGGTVKSVPNVLSGVYISGSIDNTIGGTSSGAANVISGNSGHGVHIGGVTVTSASQSDLLEGNYIGTNSANLKGLYNGQDGVFINDSGDATGSTGIPPVIVADNTISHNDWNGVEIDGGAYNQVYGNTISGNGLSKAGNFVENGVYISGSSDNTIGGTASGAGNTISGNTSDGVFLNGRAGANCPGNVVEDDKIEHNNNGNGVQVDYAFNTTVTGCTIEYNAVGIYLEDLGSDNGGGVFKPNTNKNNTKTNIKH